MKRHELSTLLGSSSDAKLLLAHVFNLTSTQVLLQENFDESILNPFIERLQAGEPLARIIGTQEFYGHSFILNEATLIPRADSETLVQAALLLKPKSILDLGTGTGCLLISLLHELNATGVGVDLSERALEAARENAKIILKTPHPYPLPQGERDIEAYLHIQNPSPLEGEGKGEGVITFIYSDWFSNVTGTFDLIISNPPYIAYDEMLDKSVLDHDPHLALFAENNGLLCYEIIFANVKEHLNKDGHVIVEIGYQQYVSVVKIANNNSFSLINQHNDLGGHIRALTFKYKTNNI